MRKYKFFLILSVVVSVFFILSWFIYDGIDIFFELVYSPSDEKTETATEEKAEKKVKRPVYKSKNSAGKEIQKRDDTVPPDTRYISSKKSENRFNAFDRFLIKIFPEQLNYVLNPYTFFLLLILSIVPVIGIFIYLIIYWFR